jgi:2-polyprenyl-3-methyl-5-hydroxy-6-metoxy-1,4-benzoquinol methylase
MYIKLFASSPNFSYLIAKNPSNVFDRSERSGQRIYAKFREEDGKIIYHISIINDPIPFMQKLKDLNESSYVNAQLSCVCPYNIAGFFDCLRSAITGTSKLEEKYLEEYNSTRWQEAVIGPFPDSEEFIKKVFASYGLQVEAQQTESFSKYYHLGGEMKLQEFLQKIYILSYYITRRLDLFKIDAAKVDKFANLSKEWLGQGDVKIQSAIIKSLCRGHKEFSVQLVEGLDKEEVEEDEIKEKLRFNFNSLHDQRHDLIVEYVNKILKEFGSVSFTEIIDYGSGEGKLSEKLRKTLEWHDHCRVLSFDARESKWTKGKSYHQRMNLLFPRFKYNFADDKIVILSEVIEHFDFYDRKRLLDIVMKELAPRYIILTTPNIEWNKTINLPAYRHWDHKIEFTPEQYQQEIVQYFGAHGYEISKTMELPNQEIQPTFMNAFVRK